MPYSAPAPRLVNPELGLRQLVARAGHNAGYDIDLTLLDAPDHRLIRSGVLLAHRIMDGRGEWYLGAPDWIPLLPKELIISMAQAELPDELADLIRPFRRRAPLSPVAALRCERREFALRDDGGITRALLRDDKVTVRRGGLTTARYREVMLTPVGPGLEPEQAEWLDLSMSEVGATTMVKFPRLVRRLGAPATGLTDFPEPPPYDPAAPVSRFVAGLFALRLRAILRADLALRGGDPCAAAELLEQVRTLRTELEGLSRLVDSEWCEDLVDELAWLVHGDREAGVGEAGEQVGARLRSERYLTLLDRLVSAARTPRLVVAGSTPTVEALSNLTSAVLTKIIRTSDRVTTDGPARAWEEAWQAVAGLDGLHAVTAHVVPAEEPKWRARLERCRDLLQQVRTHEASTERLLAGVEQMSPRDAFDAGRRFERDRAAAQQVRADLLAQWAKTKRRLG